MPSGLAGRIETGTTLRIRIEVPSKCHEGRAASPSCGVSHHFRDARRFNGVPVVFRSHPRLGIVALASFAALAFTIRSQPASAAAPRCSSEERAELLAPSTPERPLVSLSCSIQLDRNDVVTRQIIVEGKSADGMRVDCNGALIDGEANTVNKNRYTVFIRSLGETEPEMTNNRPAGIEFHNCRIRGSIRIQGLRMTRGANGSWQSSRSLGHTARAQAAAPTRIVFDGLDIVTNHNSAIYVAFGVTHVQIRNSKISGAIGYPAIYLDAESGSNIIENNLIAARVANREQIAIDGSASNIIRNNVFSNIRAGGIFLYRNCGERGIVRHQKPEHNIIQGNEFFDGVERKNVPLIWVGSRNGKRSFCAEDAGLPFGSSVDDGDFADENRIEKNIVVTRGSPEFIRDAGRRNLVVGNMVRMR